MIEAQPITANLARWVWLILLALIFGASTSGHTYGATCLVQVKFDKWIGPINAIHRAAGEDSALLIGVAGIANGLFRLDGDRVVPVKSDEPIEWVNAIHHAAGEDSGLLIGAPNGLFRLDGDRVVQVKSDEPIAWVNAIHRAAGEDSGLLIGAFNGLFRLDGDRMVQVKSDEPIGWVHAIHQAAGEESGLLIGANNGLFRLDGDRVVQVKSDEPIEQVHAIHQGAGEDSGLLIGAPNGLFRLDGDRVVQVKSDEPIGWVHAIHQAAGEESGLLIGANNGLFRLDGDRVVRVKLEEPIGSVRAFHQAAGEDSGLLIGTKNGLFRLVQLPWSEAKVAPPDSLSPNTGIPVSFKWKVRHPCVNLLARDQIRINVSAREKATVDGPNFSFNEHDSILDVITNIKFEESIDEPVKLQLKIIDDNEKIALGDAITVYVDWSLDDYIKYYLPLFSAGLFIAHTIIFVLLAFGARWSGFCWRLITDPGWDKAGLWFYFALRHFGLVQRWVMSGWFKTVRQMTHHQPYLPMSLSASGKAVYRTTELLAPDTDWERLWVQGNAGMGKSALVLELKAKFFAAPDLPTLRSAFARFGTVPIVIPLREYRHVASNPDRPEDWVANVARMAVSAFGVPFEDGTLFRAMLRSGAFLLILDGANEVDRDEEIELFARSAPAVRLLVTSQMAGSNYFINVSLPHTIHAEIEPMLHLFLGEEKGERILTRIRYTPLWDAIRSGYDVRLIADLVEAYGFDVDLPTDRPGLYQLILDSIRMPDSAIFPEETLCKTAWIMWLNGERTIQKGKHLDDTMLEPLISEDHKVLRILDGQNFEFRHDQMRSYLAARWAARHEVQPLSLFESEEAIWRLSRREQEEVWNFFGEMFVADRPDEAETLWKWCTAHPERVVLQHALQSALKGAGRSPAMVTGEQGALRDPI